MVVILVRFQLSDSLANFLIIISVPAVSTAGFFIIKNNSDMHLTLKNSEYEIDRIVCAQGSNRLAFLVTGEAVYRSVSLTDFVEVITPAIKAIRERKTLPKTAQRQPGQYWVRPKWIGNETKWLVASYKEFGWDIPGHGAGYPDSAMLEIDEKPVVREISKTQQIRQPGAYWCLIGTYILEKDQTPEWVVCKWDGMAWIVPGYQAKYGDVAMDKIGDLVTRSES